MIEYSKDLRPSKRGELEITDLHLKYLTINKLQVIKIGRGVAWLDTGTPDNLLYASTFIQAVEKRQGLKISCPEEIAYLMGFIDLEKYERIVNLLPNSDYKNYCLKIMKELS